MKKCLLLLWIFVSIFCRADVDSSLELHPQYVVAATVCISASLVNLCELNSTAEKRVRVKRVVLLREKNWAVARRLALTILGIIVGGVCAWHAAETVDEGVAIASGSSQRSDVVSGSSPLLVEVSKAPVLAASDNVISFTLSGSVTQPIVWTFEVSETKGLVLNASQAAKLNNFIHVDRALVPIELHAIVIADRAHFVLIDAARQGYLFDASMNFVAPSWADLVRQKSVRTIGALSGEVAVNNALVVNTERCAPASEERSNHVVDEDRSVSTIFDEIEKLPDCDENNGGSESEQESESMSRDSRSSASS